MKLENVEFVREAPPMKKKGGYDLVYEKMKEKIREDRSGLHYTLYTVDAAHVKRVESLPLHLKIPREKWTRLVYEYMLPPA